MSKSKHYNGLSAREVEESRARHGVNVLTPPEKTPLWKRFLEKFEDPIIIILLIAGVFSLLISCYEFFGLDKEATVFFEPIGIFVAVLLSTGLAFYFELKANQEFEILNQVNDEEPVRVIREGNTVEVPKCDIVVGDIVMIGTGDDIPADAELLESVQLTVDESTLTGEPLCAKTTVEADFDAEATFPSNHVLRGTKVMAGHGICRVLAVGDATESGKVFEAAQIDDSVKTPLNEQLDRLSNLITNISYVLAVLIIVGRVVMYFVSGSESVGFQWVDFASYLLSTIMIAVTVIVVAVPEGLPMAVTLSLAYSMRRMFRTGNLVRKMHACETMGATTVICTDKTGTLTQNRMTVAEAAFPSLPDQQLGANEESELIAEGIAVNSTATLDLSDAAHPSVLGNPTEGALLLWLHSQSRDYRTLREASKTLVELPFATERKYMAAVVESGVLDGRRVLYVKGAPEIVRSLCAKAVGDESVETLNERLLGYQRQAMRSQCLNHRWWHEAHDSRHGWHLLPPAPRFRLRLRARRCDFAHRSVQPAVRHGNGALGFGEKLHLHVLRDAPILEHVQCPRLSHGTIGLPLQAVQELLVHLAGDLGRSDSDRHPRRPDVQRYAAAPPRLGHPHRLYFGRTLDR